MTRSKDKRAKRPSAKSTESADRIEFKQVKGRTKEQEDYLNKIDENDIVISQGVAGTGKTYLAVASALKHLFNKKVSRIAITRPVISVGMPMGHLPGTFEDKLHPYLLPILDAFNEMVGVQLTTKLRETGVIEIAPLAYMRGRTFKSTFMVLDEAQNADIEEILMYMTRIGENSKMVITGDSMQSDIRYSGLSIAAKALANVDGIANVELPITSTQRHRLVPEIIECLSRLVGLTNRRQVRD